jgi:hypothetical protein
VPAIITPAQVRTLESALYDLNATESEVELLQSVGADLTELLPIREDLKRNLTAYLEYARKQPKGGK